MKVNTIILRQIPGVVVAGGALAGETSAAQSLNVKRAIEAGY